jgi:hypothetical protein
MKKLVTIREFLTSPQYAGTGDLMGGSSWFAWRTLLIAAMGEPLEQPGELAAFKELTGRPAPPADPVREFFAVMGRAGKSRAGGSWGLYGDLHRLQACAGAGRAGRAIDHRAEHG